MNLNEEQAKKVAAILENSDAAAMKILGHTKMPTMEALTTLKNDSLEKAKQVLTETQREQFGKMFGTPVKYILR